MSAPSSSSPRAVIFGCRGQLGVELVREFESRGYDVTGFGRTSVDITDRERIEHSLASIDPQVVLNAAAYNQVDVAEREPQAALAANALGVRNLALACRQIDAAFVHFSTDYVFDGTLGRAYVETDTPHPLGAYAVSKLTGELYAQAYLNNPLIIRTCGVFGPAGTRTARGNFIETMLRLSRTTQPIRVVEDHVASPTYAPWMAQRTADLVERRASGVIHLGGGHPVSWFAFARMIFDAAGLHPTLVATSEREYRTEARRPKYSALSNSRMESLGIAPMGPLDEAIRDYLRLREAVSASVAMPTRRE
ncbi:MAG: dTDP-4-dehydrorhamnose reductase [Bryobacteraceae bacterium]